MAIRGADDDSIVNLHTTPVRKVMGALKKRPCNDRRHEKCSTIDSCCYNTQKPSGSDTHARERHICLASPLMRTAPLVGRDIFCELFVSRRLFSPKLSHLKTRRSSHLPRLTHQRTIEISFWRSIVRLAHVYASNLARASLTEDGFQGTYPCVQENWPKQKVKPHTLRSLAGQAA